MPFVSVKKQNILSLGPNAAPCAFSFSVRLFQVFVNRLRIFYVDSFGNCPLMSPLNPEAKMAVTRAANFLEDYFW